jgi:hypothetical protein
VIVPPQADAPKVIEANGHATSQPVDPIAALQQAEHQLDLARVHARECRSTVAEARTAFSKALAGWNTTQPIQTQAELMKEHIASNQAERAKRYAAGQGVHYAGVGRTAMALAGGNMRNGGGAAYRRGAFTRAQAMEINAAKLKTANAAFKPRAKLPSDR